MTYCPPVMKQYIRNPKGKGGKWDTNDQDKEDHEQEQRIQEWLKREGKSFGAEFKHITRKGTARNTLIKGSISLDQKIAEDGERSGTYADIIAGCDGRDFESGDEFIDPTDKARKEIFWYLSALGFNKEEAMCLVKILKSSLTTSK